MIPGKARMGPRQTEPPTGNTPSAKVLLRRDEVFQKLTAAVRRKHSNVASIFRTDRDRSGTLSKTEMTRLLTEQVGEVTQPQLHALMTCFHTNQTDVIDYEEMLKSIQQWQREKRACGSGLRTTCDAARLAQIYTKSPGSCYWAREQPVERSVLRWRQAEAAYNRPCSVPRDFFRNTVPTAKEPRGQSGASGLVSRCNEQRQRSQPKSQSRSHSAQLGRRSPMGSSSGWRSAHAAQRQHMQNTSGHKNYETRLHSWRNAQSKRAQLN